MQGAFDFAAADLRRWRDALVRAFGPPPTGPRRSPVGQLVKSILSARTRDAVSGAAFDALVARYPDWRRVADAPVGEIAATVAEVTFAEDKAAYVRAALRRVGRERPDFDLDFLRELPLADALAWLERLPGVGRKVAATTLNASTLDRPVAIVDTHDLRVLGRLGFVRPGADARAASEAVTAAMPNWSGEEFLLFHLLLKRLGQVICRWDTPECGRCPLREDCPTGRAVTG
ncbi:endonuclease III domain-containing protein [Sphingomonas lenta]|nr:endonuclease [Sphingomonas lenta]